MTDWARRLDQWLGRRLVRLSERFQKAHPESACRVWSHSLGEATVYQGYTVGAEFQLAGGTVQLAVDLGHLDRNPGFETAQVIWLEPRVEVEFELSPTINPGPFDEPSRRRSMGRLRQGLPRLWKAFKRALRRGHPKVPVHPPTDSVIDFSAPARPEVPLEIWETHPEDSALVDAALARLAGRLIESGLGFGVDVVRRYQAVQRNWALPQQLPYDRNRVDRYTVFPRLQEWRETYRREPGFQGGIAFSRAVFASPEEAFLILRRRLGFGDSGFWLETYGSGGGEESPWSERWSEPRARELCELVRFQKAAGKWQVVDSIDLLAPVSCELQLAAIRQELEADLSAISPAVDSAVAAVSLAHVELARSQDKVRSSASWLEVDALLKSGQTLRFLVLPAFSVHSNQGIGPFERLVIVSGLQMVKVVRGIEAWLKLTG